MSKNRVSLQEFLHELNKNFANLYIYRGHEKYHKFMEFLFGTELSDDTLIVNHDRCCTDDLELNSGRRIKYNDYSDKWQLWDYIPDYKDSALLALLNETKMKPHSFEWYFIYQSNCATEIDETGNRPRTGYCDFLRLKGDIAAVYDHIKQQWILWRDPKHYPD